MKEFKESFESNTNSTMFEELEISLRSHIDRLKTELRSELGNQMHHKKNQNL